MGLDTFLSPSNFSSSESFGVGGFLVGVGKLSSCLGVWAPGDGVAPSLLLGPTHLESSIKHL